MFGASYASDTPGYLGTTFPGFPNLFLMTGPNTGLGHSSMVFMIECQLRYVIDSLKALRAHGAATFEVREEVAERYNAEVQARLSGTVWGSGCASWYLDATGRNTVIWPDFTFVYRRRTRHFDPAEYLLHGPRRQRTRSAGGPVTDSVRAELAATAGAAPART